MSIIFDFDGTIADSFDVIVSIIGRLTGRGVAMGEKEVEKLRQQPLMTVAKRLGIRPWKIPWLLIRGRLIMSRRMGEVKIHDGVGKVIEQLHAEGHELFIVSSNSARNVQSFLRTHHLQSHFVGVKGSVGLFSKARALRKLLERNNLDRDDTWYVGDETRDVEAAEAIGVRCIAVSWGFTNPDTLNLLNPTGLAAKPADIVRIINQ